MIRIQPILPLVLALVWLAASTQAGDVDPVFAMKLDNGDADTFYPALVMLADQVDIAELDRRLTAGNAPRALRHRLVIEALKAKAKATQSPVLARIRALEQSGAARGVKPLWIANAITLQARPDAIAWIASADAVLRVHDGGHAMTIPAPRDIRAGEPWVDGPTPGLVTIKADKLWAKGITGKGRVVANIDTGVDATHPALGARWRGKKVPAAQAWFDPISKTTSPGDPYPPPFGGHGTHTMGTLCGDDQRAGKRIGVAPEAEWIAVGMIAPPFPPIPQQQMMNHFMAALQWIADPDGSALTVVDAPDVVSNSWGFNPGSPPYGVPSCDQTLWPAIDACEAAGVAVVFAAGNFQSPTPGLFSIPADRITSPTNCYSVGAVNQDGKTIASFSARGPSSCDNKTIKPEVVAPGVQVESSVPGGTYQKQDGTSMSTPHVAGSIALLRQANPDISSTRVKEILMETATDLGSQGEDNTFGHGLINLEAAHAKVVAERGVAQVSLVTTTPKPSRPSLIWLHLSASNYTPVPQLVWFQLDILLNGKPFANLIPPIAPVLPGNFSLDQSPVPVIIPLPPTLPANLIGVPITFRATLKQNAKEISRADAGVVIQ